MLKTHNYKILKPSTFLSSGYGKLLTKSGLTILLLLLQQSLFAQAVNTETITDTYYNFIIVIMILLIASIFIGLEILDDPKYESKDKVHFNKSKMISDSLLFPGYKLDKNITSKLKIVFYSASILVLMYAVLILLMF